MTKASSAARLPSKDAPGTPLYRRLAQKLKEDIVGGAYPVGSLLPTEQELCDRFSASRYTVREALRLLGEDGMVARRQGRGSEVISNQERPVYAQSLTSLTQLYDYAAETELVVEKVSRIVPDETLAIELGRLPGREWLLVQGIRKTSDGAVICVSRVFIHQDFADLSGVLKSHKGAIHRLIEQTYGVRIEEVHQEISSVVPDRTISKTLGDAEGTPAILVTRRYLDDDDRPVIVSMNWHQLPGFTYSQVIRRE